MQWYDFEKQGKISERLGIFSLSLFLVIFIPSIVLCFKFMSAFSSKEAAFLVPLLLLVGELMVYIFLYVPADEKILRFLKKKHEYILAKTEIIPRLIKELDRLHALKDRDEAWLAEYPAITDNAGARYYDEKIRILEKKLTEQVLITARPLDDKFYRKVVRILYGKIYNPEKDFQLLKN